MTTIKSISKMVYFLLLVTIFVVASYMTETNIKATGEITEIEKVAGEVLSVDANSDYPSLTIGTKDGDIEIAVSEQTVISGNKRLKDIFTGDNVTVKYSAQDMRNTAENITIAPKLDKSETSYRSKINSKEVK